MEEWPVDVQCTGDVVELVYADLRAIAARYMQSERAEHTLSPTALVHEAWVRLDDQRRAHWNGAAHFRAVASIVMRRVLVDHAVRRGTAKRGGGRVSITLGAVETEAETSPIDIIALDDALRRLASMDPTQARIVELRFFGCLTNKQTSELLGISTRTAEREWRSARAWLLAQINGEPLGGRSPADEG